MKNYSCKLKRLALSALFGAFVQAVACHAMPGEGITRNAAGDYVISYWNGASMMQTKFVPATKIDPVISSLFRINERQEVMYQYKLSNKAHAQQPIIAFKFLQISGIKSKAPITDIPVGVRDVATAVEFVKTRRSSLRIPTGWSGDVSPATPTGLFVEWHYVYKNLDQDNLAEGLLAGRSESDFGYISLDLPGIAEAQIQGDGRHPEYEDEGPDSDSIVVSQLEQLEANNFVPRNVAVPTIAVPAPFNAAVLLDRIRNHVATWPNKQLVDSAFAAQLDRYLVSAANAYRHNQFKAGKEHIETLREMLKREHKDLDHDDDEIENGKRAEKNDEHRTVNQRIFIDRLAARILDFDLKYVLKRTEREDDDHKKH